MQDGHSGARWTQGRRKMAQSRPNIDWTDFAQRLTHESVLLLDYFLDADPFPVFRRILARKGIELNECFGHSFNSANIYPLELETVPGAWHIIRPR